MPITDPGANFPLTHVTNQERVTRLLADAEFNLRDVAGRLNMRGMLPPFFNLVGSDHSTGTQYTIYLETAELGRLDIWEGSVWKNPSYNFNDKAKVLGLKPYAEFAQELLERFFNALIDALAAKIVAEEEAAAKAKADREQEHLDRVAAFAKLLAERNLAA